VKILLDTCVLIYFGCENLDKIGAEALKRYQDIQNEIFVSQISFWEISIKINIGKLVIPIGLKNLMQLSEQAGIKTIPIRNSHILYYQNLERKEEHKDPFDRFLISVSAVEGLYMATNDFKFDLYPEVKRVWN
jgi:PIN domain nuclease of toxin-antitoxin system